MKAGLFLWFTKFKLRFLLFLSLSLLVFSACKVEPEQDLPEQKTPKTVQSELKAVDFLLFKAEQSFEIWKNEEPIPPKHLFTLNIEGVELLPMGIFEVLQKDSSFNLHLPGLFYKEKLEKHPINKEQWNLHQENIDLSSLLEVEGKTYLLAQMDGVKINRALIFPNDARKDQGLRACFACPHWMAENYGKLEIELKKYQR